MPDVKTQDHVAREAASPSSSRAAPQAPLDRLARVRAASRVSLPRPALAGALAAAVALAAAACGTGGLVSGGDVTHGKQVFNSAAARCSTCHTLAAAGARRHDRAEPRQRVLGRPAAGLQAEHDPADRGRPDPRAAPGRQRRRSLTSTSRLPALTVMPADLVHGKDLQDVSAFVARCAGNPDDPLCRGSGSQITATDGKTIFQQAGCGSCHTLKDAGTTGTVGPNLDQMKPSRRVVEAGHERRRGDAGVQVQAVGRPDRRRREVRLLGRGHVNPADGPTAGVTSSSATTASRSPAGRGRSTRS